MTTQIYEYRLVVSRRRIQRTSFRFTTQNSWYEEDRDTDVTSGYLDWSQGRRSQVAVSQIAVWDLAEAGQTTLSRQKHLLPCRRIS